MSQPFQRACSVPAPRKPDERLNEWWVESPWHIVSNGKSLSGFERNRAFLNDRGQHYFEISALTTADSEGDGRAVVATDFNGDGREDLIVRQAGGGAVLLFANRFSDGHWLKISLQGTQSNRMGIGSRLEAHVGGESIVRELYPVNGFKAQGTTYVHFGLGEATAIDRLHITWPSGLKQEWHGLKSDQHLLLQEGASEYSTYGFSRSAPTPP